MASERKIMANRRNSLLSTGPRTAAGKAISRLNALRHGLLSREVLLVDEAEDELIDFSRRIRADLAPVGEMELLLVDRIIAAAWRLRRCIRLESSLLGCRFESYRDSVGVEEEAWSRTLEHELSFKTSWEKLMRYEGGLERSLYRSVHELQRLQTARARGTATAPIAIDVEVAGT